MRLSSCFLCFHEGSGGFSSASLWRMSFFLRGRLEAPFILHQPPTQCSICGLLFPCLLEEQNGLRGLRKGRPWRNEVAL